MPWGCAVARATRTTTTTASATTCRWKAAPTLQRATSCQRRTSTTTRVSTQRWDTIATGNASTTKTATACAIHSRFWAAQSWAIRCTTLTPRKTTGLAFREVAWCPLPATTTPTWITPSSRCAISSRAPAVPFPSRATTTPRCNTWCLSSAISPAVEVVWTCLRVTTTPQPKSQRPPRASTSKTLWVIAEGIVWKTPTAMACATCTRLAQTPTPWACAEGRARATSTSMACAMSTKCWGARTWRP